MGITVAAIRAAVNTATGNQDFTTTDLGGLTPKAAYFVVSYAVTDATAADHAMLCIGAATSTSNRWAAAIAAEHAAPSSDTYCSGSTTTCVRIISPLDGTVDGEADFVSFITNGVRINWSNAPAAAYLMTVVLFAGSDLTAHANNVALGDTLNNAVDVTAPAFRPDLVLTALIPTIVGEICYGMVHENGADTVVQRAYSPAARDGQNTMNNWAMVRSDSGIFETSTGGGIDWWGEFGGFDSSGFTVTTRNAGANSTTLYYLALDFAGAAGAWVGTHLSATATGNQAITDPGFEPQFLMIFPHLVTADNGAASSTAARAHSGGVAVLTSTVQYCTTITDADDLGTSDTQSLSDDRAISLPAITGALDIEATFVSFDGTGYTLNFSNVATEQKRWPALAIEVSAAGTTLTVQDATHAHTAEAPALTQHNVLALQEASHAHSVDNVVLTQHYVLVVADATHAHSVESVALTQHHALAVADALHAHAADNVALTQHNALIVQDALHAHSVDNVVLVQHYILVVADATHSHASDAIVLGIDLLVQDATHAHASESPALVQHYQLTVADTLHAHDADNVTLEIAGQLGVQEATHGHTAGNVALVQHHVLVVQDALHGHAAETVQLTVLLVVQDAAHGHSVDNVTLGGAALQLVVQDALHGHTVDNVALTQHHALLVADASHAHGADQAVFATGVDFVVMAIVAMRFVAHTEVEMRFTATNRVSMRFTAQGEVEL